MALDIQIKTSQETQLHLTITGQLDTNTAANLETAIQKALNSKITAVIFDLQGLKFISSAGLRILAKTQKIMKKRSGKVYFTNLQPQVRKVFDIVKAVSLSHIFASVAELDDYLACMQKQVINDNQ